MMRWNKPKTSQQTHLSWGRALHLEAGLCPEI